MLLSCQGGVSWAPVSPPATLSSHQLPMPPGASLTYADWTVSLLKGLKI